MSGFLLEKYRGISPYVPGEQPKEAGYIKLNTNESPFPPSEKARKRYMQAFDKLNLYNDPENGTLTGAIAEEFGLKRENVLVTNGSDEALAFIYMAYAEKGKPFAAPEVSYGFYPVFSRLVGADIVTKPLKEDLTVDAEAFAKCDLNVIFANPNAQTGTFMPISDIEKIAKKRSRLVVVDEAYVDFGAESAAALIRKYPNIVVVRTFSKSRSLAGARIGFVIAAEDIVADLKLIKYSFNPYNLGRAAEAAATGAFEDKEYFDICREKIIEAREYTLRRAEALGLRVIRGKANFLLMSSEDIDGGELKNRLYDEKIIVRHFSSPALLSPYIRVTIGSMDEMKTFIKVLEKILSGVRK